MLFAQQEEAFGTAIPCKNVRSSIKGKTVEQCSTHKLTMESAITDSPDASSATDDQCQGSSSTADGRFSYSVIHNYLSKQSYPAHFSKEDKHAFRKRAQHFACTEDGELYYVGGASSKCACQQ